MTKKMFQIICKRFFASFTYISLFNLNLYRLYPRGLPSTVYFRKVNSAAAPSWRERINYAANHDSLQTPRQMSLYIRCTIKELSTRWKNQIALVRFLTNPLLGFVFIFTIFTNLKIALGQLCYAYLHVKLVCFHFSP